LLKEKYNKEDVMSKNKIKAYRTLKADDISLAVLEAIRTVNAARAISTPNIGEIAAITTAINGLTAQLRRCYDRQ
jgi:hypothetical protein